MKYCAKCGTQLSDDTMVCPKCHPETNKSQPQLSIPSSPTKNNSNKITPLILTNVIIATLTLIAVILMYFIQPSNNSSIGGTNSNVFTSTCPADAYGNHDWSPARCTEPSQCYNCNAYRDDKLGEHSFYTDDDGFCDCSYCGMLYQVYINSLD